MARDNEQGEKTEEATQQRREEFRRRGQVAYTKELAATLALFGGLASIWMFGRFFLDQVQILLSTTISDYLIQTVREGDWKPAAMFAFQKGALLISPVMGIFFALGAISSVIQTGFIYNEEALQFKPERLDPIQGFKRIMSLKGLVEGLKALAKLILISIVGYLVLSSQFAILPHLVDFGIPEILVFIGDVVGRLILAVGMVMLVLSAFDFMFQRWDLEQEMMMTKQELKEEVKSREGDPMVRGRIKRMQREIAGRRMMEEVPKADVIVTNPTHIAVALKYDETMVAPKLIAKGADLVAERIKSIAREKNIPIIENKPLARTIFKTLKLGQAIPKELYTAVAEVLAYVYKLRRKMI